MRLRTNIIVLITVLILQQILAVSSYSNDCGVSIEGDDDITYLFIYNMTTDINVQLKFPDVVLSPFWDSSLKQNNVCISDASPAIIPSFSTQAQQQIFEYTCKVVDSEQFDDWFLQPIIINLGKPANCNCTIIPGDANQTQVVNGTYISSLTITIEGNYTIGWLDYDWVLMGCNVSVNYATTPLGDGDTFQQFIVTQSHYIPNDYNISFWVVLGLMMGGAILVVAIALIFVARKRDDAYFFNTIRRR